MNKLEIIGNLGADAKMIKLTSGRSLIEFSVATTEIIKTQDKSFPSTSWHLCKHFVDKISTKELKKLTKGASIKVVGSLNYNQYDKKVGTATTPVKVAFVNVSELEIV